MARSVGRIEAKRKCSCAVEAVQTGSNSTAMVIGDVLVWVAIGLCLFAAIKPERTKRWLHFVGPPWGIRAFAVVALVLFVALPFVPMR